MKPVSPSSVKSRRRERVPSQTVEKLAKARIEKHKYLPTLPSLLTKPDFPLIHRDISWLQFNERVLEQARPSSQNRPLERVKFLAISASNLDEFFMIRLASLSREIALLSNDKSESQRLVRIRDSILETVARFGARQSEILDLLSAELADMGIHIIRNPEESNHIYEIGKKLFEEQVLPKLKPPTTMSQQSLCEVNNLQMAVIFPDGLFFRVPRSLPPVMFVQSENNKYFFFLDSILLTYLSRIFRPHDSPAVVRLTRDADVTSDLISAGTEPTPDVIRHVLRGKDNGPVVRLQFLGNISSEILNQCVTGLNLEPSQVFPAPSSLCLHGLWELLDKCTQDNTSGSELLYSPLESFLPEPFHYPDTLFDKLKERDYLLHHPYDSFDAFLKWIHAACEDPDVKSIELTVYRIGALSPIVPYLKKAAKKQKVRILIELRVDLMNPPISLSQRNSPKLALRWLLGLVNSNCMQR